MKKECFFKGFIHAAGVFIYIAAVVSVLFNNQKIFGGAPDFFIPVFMLLLFVISASITGFLVLGRPIQLYISGFKREVFFTFFSTIFWLVVFLGGVVAVLLYF